MGLGGEAGFMGWDGVWEVGRGGVGGLGVWGTGCTVGCECEGGW